MTVRFHSVGLILEGHQTQLGKGQETISKLRCECGSDVLDKKINTLAKNKIKMSKDSKSKVFSRKYWDII